MLLVFSLVQLLLLVFYLVFWFLVSQWLFPALMLVVLGIMLRNTLKEVTTGTNKVKLLVRVLKNTRLQLLVTLLVIHSKIPLVLPLTFLLSFLLFSLWSLPISSIELLYYNAPSLLDQVVAQLEKIEIKCF